ncbi:Acetyltransferase (GNAT) family protein [Nocardia amikacinitolerans]|uniref:GNAT family N-acetyltransferase n=1 Tax=Nocardia amikacinitolerans TaxID=756689 RepID=UPI000A05997D|nr:GNAT family N-acetyltransferase [Nocardia amikacinitolerans]MCP2317581.1 Acetyltransferase (GNAT) family protein [Nocardia amikacinitolerans]
MTTVFRQADLGDLGMICRLRVQRTAWLTARGSDQWTIAGRGLPIEIFARGVGRSLDAGETWIAEVDGEPAATITVNDRADPGLWSQWELADAVVVHFMIVDLRFAGQRLGHRLLAHAGQLARERDRDWVRLDAWTTNADLHDYYRRAGFHLARIAGPIARGPSRALFERRTDSWDFEQTLAVSATGLPSAAPILDPPTDTILAAEPQPN